MRRAPSACSTKCRTRLIRADAFPAKRIRPRRAVQFDRPERKSNMPKFAANLTMLFNEVPFLDRFAAAADAGFNAVEFLFPYPYQSAELAERLQQNRLKLVLHNLPAGNWEAGERGIACLPDRVGEFQQGVDRAIEYGTENDRPPVNFVSC